MAGFANLFVLGQPDPSQQLAAMLSGQQQPGQQPLQGPAPPGGSPPAGGAGGAQQAPGAQLPNSQPQPQALQSSPDMAASYQQLANPPNIMSLYLQMQRRDQAMQGINSALATIMANHSPPSMRQSIMQGIGGGGADAGQTMGNLMSLYQAQQGMAAQQQLLGQAPQIAQKLNMDEGTVRAEIMAGRGPDLIKNLEPTEQQRNIGWEHDQYIKGGGTEEDWQKNYLPLIITGGIPGATPDTRQRVQALTKWQNDPANAGRPPPDYLSNDQKWKLYNTDLQDAKGSFNGMNQALGTFVDKLGDVSSNKNLDELTGSLSGAAKGGFQGLIPGSDAYNLHSDLKALGGTAKALASRQGPKGVGQNLALLGANPDDYTNYGIGNFRENVIAPKIRIALQAQANAYGAAGRLSEMPGYLQQYLDPMYKPGGDLDPGGGFKPFKANKDLKPLDAEAQSGFQNDLEHYGPKVALDNLKKQGYDTSSVE